MAAKDRFSYETQGAVSIALALLAGVAALTAIALLARNYRPDAGYTLYSPRSMWFPMVMASLLGGIALSAAGLGLGLNSAGQKRNTQSGRAWIGFFLSAATLAVLLIEGLFFFFTRQTL